jgi:hypothetical protein
MQPEEIIERISVMIDPTFRENIISSPLNELDME